VGVSPFADSALCFRDTLLHVKFTTSISLEGIRIMKKVLRFETPEVVEVSGDSAGGALYIDRGRKVGEIVSQLEASDLPELGTVSAARLLRVRCVR
jgi:hypothetical protein